MQTESEKSKANKLTHRHTHAFRVNIKKSRAFMTITRLINIVELINAKKDCSHVVLSPDADQGSTLDHRCVLKWLRPMLSIGYNQDIKIST